MKRAGPFSIYIWIGKFGPIDEVVRQIKLILQSIGLKPRETHP